MVQTTKTQPSDTLRGVALLDDPIRNKGTAFTSEERRQYGLEGLLPHSVENLDRQVERVMEHLDAKPNDLERYIYLIGLSDRNETLFYRAVMSDPARFIPILYDPTVADACLAFGHIYRRARGVYITREMKGRIAEVLRNWPEQDGNHRRAGKRDRDDRRLVEEKRSIMTSPCAYSRSGLRRTCDRRSSRSISAPRPAVAVACAAPICACHGPRDRRMTRTRAHRYSEWNRRVRALCRSS